ncbi:endonuclease/exonuclease/phosphatase family protein [Acidobacteriota bacterium]
MELIVSAFAVVALYVIGVVLLNRLQLAPECDTVDVVDNPSSSLNKEKSLQILTWNIGYAGMGKEADFIFDGGKQLRPRKKEYVYGNLTGIERFLIRHYADFYLFQEVARPSLNTYGIDVSERLRKVLTRCAWCHSTDLKTRLLYRRFGLDIGNSFFSRYTIRRCTRIALPVEPNFILGCFRKHYRLLVSEIETGDSTSLFLINLHLAAFDKDAQVRNAQLKRLRAFILEQYEKGHSIVVGGDWNLRLAPVEFPHQTEDKNLFWIYDLPQQFTPSGWTWAVDQSTPTVRTAHKPFKPGTNYTLIVDGFLCSPNVSVLSVKTADLHFENTDHHPVIVTVKIEV